MSQSKKGSLLEVCLNTATGFTAAWIITIYLMPLYDFDVTLKQSWEITFIFTIVSIVRSYLWRRCFNYFIIKKEVEHG